MRAVLTIIAALVLCATPVAAQGKTKVKTAAGVELLDACEVFAKGDPQVVETVQALGWDISEDGGEGPFVQAFSGGKTVPGIGDANLYALIENYPDSIFSYCRIDVVLPEGDNSAIAAIAELPRYRGQTQEQDGGLYLSMVGADDAGRMLLAQRTDDSLVIQLSVTRPKPVETAPVPPAPETDPAAQPAEAGQ